jgi:pectate lyase
MHRWASLFFLNLSLAATLSWSAEPVGADNKCGCLENPKQVNRLEITRPGTYENYLVDSQWQGGNRVKITADNVIIRNFEIRNATGNGIGVFGKNVIIENCKIHHLLNGSFENQHDAHGITGHPQNLQIRNCDISYTSGDSIQFDPDRREWSNVIVENCTLWTGPLPASAGTFQAGQRPGENGFDSKTPATGERSKITFKRCLFHGWNQPGQIGMLAAINAKENVDITIDQCTFRDNQVAFRLRGPGKNGGAKVLIKDCSILDTQLGVRMENKIENLKIQNLGFGKSVARKYQQLEGSPGPGYENTGEHTLE